MTWHPIKTHPPTAADLSGRQAVELINHDGTRAILYSFVGKLPSWATHWRPVELAPPPEKQLTQADKDKKAFDEYWSRGSSGFYDVWVAACMYARKSLREAALGIFSRESLSLLGIAADLRDRGLPDSAEVLFQLSRLLEGEEGK